MLNLYIYAIYVSIFNLFYAVSHVILKVFTPFGEKIHSLKLGQLVQITSDITNHDDTPKEFVYLVEIRDTQNQIIQPLKWITGQLDSAQTLNLGLSWIPTNTGNFYADVYLGTGLDFVSHTETISIVVLPQDHLS